MNSLSTIRILALLFSINLIGAVQAALFRYDVDVVSNSVTIASGYYVFDNNIPPPPPDYLEVSDGNLLQKLDFSFNGVDYNKTTENGGVAFFL